MDSAVFLGREASLELCTKSSTASGHSADSDWQIISVYDSEAVGLSTNSPQAVTLQSAPRSVVDCSDSDTSTVAASKLNLCAFDLGLPCTSRKVKTPRSRRGKPKLLPLTEVAMANSPPDKCLSPELLNEPVGTPMAVKVSVNLSHTQDQVSFRTWNPFARYLSTHRWSEASAHNLDLARLPFPPGDGTDNSDFTKDRRLSSGSGSLEHANFPACCTNEKYDSEPDIDSVLAPGVIDVPCNPNSSTVPQADEVDFDHKVPLDYDTAQKAATVSDDSGDAAAAAINSNISTIPKNLDCVVELSQGIKEKKQANVLRGAKKSRRSMRAAMLKEKSAKTSSKKSGT